jgi:hypothetical protein
VRDSDHGAGWLVLTIAVWVLGLAIVVLAAIVFVAIHVVEWLTT